MNRYQVLSKKVPEFLCYSKILKSTDAINRNKVTRRNAAVQLYSVRPITDFRVSSVESLTKI